MTARWYSAPLGTLSIARHPVLSRGARVDARIGVATEGRKRPGNPDHRMSNIQCLCMTLRASRPGCAAGLRIQQIRRIRPVRSNRFRRGWHPLCYQMRPPHPWRRREPRERDDG